MHRKEGAAYILIYKKLLCGYIFFLFLFSVSVATMPAGWRIQSQTIALSVFSGMSFWLGLAGMAGCIFGMRRLEKKEGCKTSKKDTRKRVGFHFFRNSHTVKIDVCMAVSLIAAICMQSVFHKEAFAFIISAVFLFLFGMHCILNATGYRYFMYQNKKGNES